MANQAINIQDQKMRRDAYYGEAKDPNRVADEIPESPDDILGDGVSPHVVRRQQSIEAIAGTLIQKRTLAVTARAACGIERRWREDEMAFDGMDEAGYAGRMIDYATQTAPLMSGRTKGPRRSRVIVNVLRGKCETAEGRFTDIQLPTDGKNWGLKTTPVVELVKLLKDETPVKRKGDTKQLTNQKGEPQTFADVAAADQERTTERMKGMESVIDDQLTECGYNGQQRLLIRNAVRLGTGVMKGPVIVRDVKRTWEKITDKSTTVRVLRVKEDQKPSSKSVDPWNVYPDPECSDDRTKMAYLFERESILPRELRDLSFVDGYLADQIAAVLLEDPQRLNVAQEKDVPLAVKYEKGIRGTSYEKWEFHGDLDKEDLEALGCDCSDERYRNVPTVSACVVLVNDRPIKVMLNPQDTGEIPYDFWQWTSVSGLIWGMSLVRQGIWMQRIIQAAFRCMMDNMGDSSGANIILGKGVVPHDGKWEITGKKIWKYIGDGQDDMRKAMNQFQIDNNQADLESVIKLALKFMDLETVLPLIFQGDKGEQMPKTLGATNIMIDSNNVALRGRVKLYDDHITRPHLQRYFDYNMQYHPDDGIKGDFRVDPRGSSVLLAKDQQADALEQALALREDEELRDYVDWVKTLTKYFESKHLDILKSPEKIEGVIRNKQKVPPKPDPKIEGALQVATIRAQGEMAKAELTQTSDMAELQFKAEQARVDREHELQMKALDHEIKMMELSAKTGMALDKIKSDLARDAQKLKTQVQLAKDKDVGPAEQVATPIAEPAGRASEGRAFQE